MSDKQEISDKTMVSTADKQMALPMDEIRALYIFSTDPVERFSRRYNLTPAAVERFVKEGRWDELRSLHTQSALRVLGKLELALVEDFLDTAIKGSKLEWLKYEEEMEWMVKYRAEHGHGCKIDSSTGDIITDMDGRPIYLRIPKAPASSIEFVANLSKHLKNLAAEMSEAGQLAPPNAQDVTPMTYESDLFAPAKKE